MGRKLLRLLNGLITFTVTVCLLAAGSYAGYALWDNQQIYDSAESVNEELREIRSTIHTPTLSAMEQMLEESRRVREAEAAERAAAEAAAAEQNAAETERTSEAETEAPAAEERTAASETAAADDAAGTETAGTEETAKPETADEAGIRADGQIPDNGSSEEDPESIGTEASGANAADRTEASPDEKPETDQTGTETAQTAVPQTAEAAAQPTPAPDDETTAEPTAVPTEETATESAATLTAEPAAEPTAAPTAEPTVAPTEVPTPEPTPDNSPFGQLKQINQDITAWITLPGTAIDYPVLQGPNNYSYINTDVYGNFALAGSIFLDSRNDAAYGDRYSLLYGHNMSYHKMFSDINLYKKETFFSENTLGLILLPDGFHILESISVVVTPASDSGLMNPENWEHFTTEQVMDAMLSSALHVNEKGLEDMRTIMDAGETPRILALSTCSEEFTDARTILLMLLEPDA